MNKLIGNYNKAIQLNVKILDLYELYKEFIIM